jgi:ectoine hydroxylase-related dioxygenase (phytanoyl-CoA dioxygenase family)
MLDDFTLENGALRVVPGSHRWKRLPQDALSDPLAPHDGEVLVTAPAGTVVVMNAHAWHGGTENRPSSSIKSSCCAPTRNNASVPKCAGCWRWTIL